MNPDRRASLVTGTLFIVATVAALAADALLPRLSGAQDLVAIAEHPARLSAAALAYLVAAVTSVGVAIAVYPVLRETHPALALGSVVFRAIEAVFYVAAVVDLLSLRSLGQTLAVSAAEDQAPLRALAGSWLAHRDHATLAGVVAFSVGALMYYAVLHALRRVPGWLSGWGIAGTLLMLTACVLALWDDRPVTGYTGLIVPIAIQEMVLAGWLLAKGFRPPLLR